MQSHPSLSFSSLSLMMSISLSLASRAVEKPDDHRGTFTLTGAEIRPAGGAEEEMVNKLIKTVKHTLKVIFIELKNKGGSGRFCKTVLQQQN